MTKYYFIVLVCAVLAVSCANSSYDPELEIYKARFHKWIINNSRSTPNNFLAFREVSDIDDPKNFFDGNYETKLNKLPFNATIDTPWSANYWSIKKGGLSFRYGLNTSYHKNETWKEYTNSYQQPEDHKKYYGTENWDYVVNNMYSPAEKYDLLVGDYNYTLTNRMKKEGYQVRRDANGDVPGWMGKCHGWTPASIYEPRPSLAVNITAADNKTIITFYPEDIRGLASIYWAEAKYENKMAGSRCEYANFSKIPHDNKTGLWDDYRCFTVNPGSLVTILANQLGLRNKSLIYDPDSNGEIWNQPVFGYNMRFYNPISNISTDLSNATVPVSEIISQRNTTNILDFLARKISKKSKKIVGVIMTVMFVFENPPIFGNRTAEDNTDTREYQFFLELNENDEIVGGEWTENDHPIFIWMKAENGRFIAWGEEEVKTFNGTVKELNDISETAKVVSDKNTVLGAIMRYFVKKSSVNDTRLVVREDLDSIESLEFLQ